MNIVLASQSPRRKALLQEMGLVFQSVPAEIDEVINNHETPMEASSRIALEKAQVPAKQGYKGLIIAADTMVVLNDRVLGKPIDADDAVNMLGLLSGRKHQVMTSVCVLDTNCDEYEIQTEITEVYFKDLTREEIDYYVATTEPMDKAGAYAIQGRASLFVNRIEGCYFNVVGLPLHRLYLMLEKRGFSLLRGD
ncbi:MAG: Maf family protein [Syntrophomonadaceae bacterium]